MVVQRIELFDVVAQLKKLLMCPTSSLVAHFKNGASGMFAMPFKYVSEIPQTIVLH